MRLSTFLLFTLVSISGCASISSPFANRTKPRESDRDRMVADINAKLDRGDLAGARRLMDQLDPAAAQADADRRPQTQGIEIAAGVEHTGFQPGPQIRPGPTQPTRPVRDTRSERDRVIDELLTYHPPVGRDVQRAQYATFQLPQLLEMRDHFRRVQASGQSIRTWPMDEMEQAARPPNRETAFNSPLDAPEPRFGPRANALGMPFPDGPGGQDRTAFSQGLANEQSSSGVAASRLPDGAVQQVSGSDFDSIPSFGEHPVINPDAFPARSDSRRDPRVPLPDITNSQLSNPTGSPAVLMPHLEIPGDTGAGRHDPGHSPVGLPLPPIPTADDPPGVFQRASETIAAQAAHVAQVAQAWGQPENPASASLVMPLSPIASTINALEAELATATPEETSGDEIEYEKKAVLLRMLHLVDGRPEQAVEPIQNIDSRDREFWQQMFWGMTNHFDTRGIPQENTRAAETIDSLRSAISRLQDKADLRLRNVTFSHSIISFGNYERFKHEQFTTGQSVLLYAEIENFTSKALDDKGFQTALRSDVEIYRYGKNGEPAVARIPFDVTKDVCRNVRRDYFHSYEFTVPEDLEPGRYVLVLQVNDQLSGKYATSRVQFEVQ